jgi:SAM-dependent methyltransferase
MPVPVATLAQRIDYGRRVVTLAARMLAARARAGVSAVAPLAVVPYNGMFRRDGLSALEAQRRALETFDLYLFDIMNSVRLQGEKVFEYGTLLHGIPSWRNLRVLDVGTGRSTLPQWMTFQGARVTPLDLDTPAEDRWGGFQVRVNDVVARRAARLRGVAASMRCLPFQDGAFDVVTSLSVVEHLDTDLPARTYVPYAEQRRRLARVLDESIRVTAPGGHIYLTSECCDYDRARVDTWRSAYYYVDGPALSAAWPVRDVRALFYDYVAERGCELVGGVQYDPAIIDDLNSWSNRGPYFSGFSMLARKRQGTIDPRSTGSGS